MKRNYALAGLVVAALGIAVWLATTFLGADGSTGLEMDLAPRERDERTEVVQELERAQPDAGEEALEVARTAVEATAEIEAVDPWASELGGLIGRVVEEDDTPVAGIAVALVQVDANIMLAADWARLGEEPPKLVIDRTVTDEEGRFRMAGGYDASFHGLGVDLRGPRATVRVVDAQLHHGEVTDVGDIVLRGGCNIFGRVLDDAGNPVAGARVRIVPSHPEVPIDQVVQVGVQDFRSDCAVGISKMVVEGIGSPLVELPPYVRNHIDDLPIPTATTNDKGEYRFEGAPVGLVLQGVDMPGWLGVCRQFTTEPGEMELDDAVLTVGRTVFGIVVDDTGEPVEGIEVLAGSELFFGEAAILHPTGRTGPDGRFSLTGCPDTGGAMALARRSPDEPWIGELVAGGEEIEIEIESTVAITVRVMDYAGDPVRGARVELAPGVEDESPMGFIGRFMSLGAEPLKARFRETDEGVYVCDEVTPGNYEVTAWPQDLACARKKVELWEGTSEVLLVCQKGEGVELTVYDAETKEGVANARASVVTVEPPFLSALAVGRTDREGRTQLGPYSFDRDEKDRGFGGWMEGNQILVQHPRYADAAIPLAEGARSAAVELVRGGEIHGQITWGSDPPQRIYMVILENRSGVDGMMEAFLPPRVGRSSLTGSFRFTNLPPGTYRLAVFERYFDGDPISLLLAEQEPTMVHREDDVVLEVSGRTDVVIDLTPSGRGQTARIAGSVFVDGAPVVDASVRVSGPGPSSRVRTDERGEFETDEFLAMGNVYVRVSGDVETVNGSMDDVELYNDTITPEPQSVHRLDLDLRSAGLRVTVTGVDSQPLAGVRLFVQSRSGGGGRATTDESGEAALVLVGDGEFSVVAQAEGHAKRSVQVDPASGDFTGELQIELTGAIACAGICDLSALNVTPNTVFLALHPEGTGDDSWEHLDDDDIADDGRASFRLEGLEPGRYEAWLWVDGNQTEQVVFELPEGGDENLLLDFTEFRGEK